MDTYTGAGLYIFIVGGIIFLFGVSFLALFVDELEDDNVKKIPLNIFCWIQIILSFLIFSFAFYIYDLDQNKKYKEVVNEILIKQSVSSSESILCRNGKSFKVKNYQDGSKSESLISDESGNSIKCFSDN